MDAANDAGPQVSLPTGRLSAFPEGLVETLLRIITTAVAGDGGLILKRRRGSFVSIAGVDLRRSRSDRAAGRGIPQNPSPVILRRVVGRRRPLLLHSKPSADSRAMAAAPGLCLPLIHGGQVAGVLYIEKSRRRAGGFTDDQRRMVALLAEEAATTMTLVDRYDSEMRALQARVNPPFLHNTLSVIAELVRVDPSKAEGAILMLSRLYRCFVDSSCERIVTLGEEVAISRDYLTLERYRLGDRMRTDIDVDGPLEHVHVPCLLLQSLVENIVSHGVASKVGDGRVRIDVSVNERRCRLRVQDDGPTWEERSARAGPGLRTVRDRLAVHYPRNHSFRIQKGEGLSVEICIPRGRPVRHGQRKDQ